jgi:glycosyltransferase involved in cell wall biosynthesis
MNKKIIHIVSRMNVGGPSKIVNFFHENIHEYQYESILICGYSSEEEGEIKPISKPGLEVIYLKGLSPGASYWESFKAFVKLLKIIIKVRPNIIHSHQAKAGLYGRLGGFLLGVPKRIHTYHGHVFYGYFPPLKTKIIILIEKILAHLGTDSLAISPEILNDITNRFKICNPTKTTLINVGVDVNLFSSLPSPIKSKQTYGLPLDKFIIGFVGRLVEIKNPIAFILLAKELTKLNNELHFVIAGDGTLKELVLEKIKENNLEKKITILPWIANIEDLLVSLNLLVMTSINEGTPLILMESMLIGVPVASTPVGGVMSLIEHEKTGLLLTGSTSNNAEKLNKFINTYEESTLKMIPLAKEKIRENFSLDKILNQTVKLYDKKK